MSDNSVAEKTISHLKSRLESAISARSELEEEFSAQSVLLTNFIGKLSQACKGTDILLDNKLAHLRATLKNPSSVTDLAKEIKAISALLQKHSLQNDKNSLKIHEQLLAYSANLQKVEDLPNQNRRQLKALFSKIQQSQSSLIEYVPLMSEFIACYDNALQTQVSQSTATLANVNNVVAMKKINKGDDNDLTDQSETSGETVSTEILQHFKSILNSLMVSEKHKKNIVKIRSTLKGKVSNQVLITKCLNVLDLILADVKQERSSAKVFLSTLSDALSSVQASVSSTIASTEQCYVKNNKVNQEITDNISEITIGITDTSSLTNLKVDVNEKLQKITKTLKKKKKLEEQQHLDLLEQLNTMASTIEQLELRSQDFEKRIIEQQVKSMQDALTKLSNRAAFDEYFAREIVRYHYKKFDLAISVIDLDNFKRINDTYGHTAGDKTLQVIANTLTKFIGQDAFISRYGGEEFVLIFSDTKKDIVMKKLNVLLKKVENLPFTFKGNRVNITLSIGVTLIQQDDNVHSAFERADTALYQAKKDGKNRVIYG